MTSGESRFWRPDGNRRGSFCWPLRASVAATVFLFSAVALTAALLDSERALAQGCDRDPSMEEVTAEEIVNALRVDKPVLKDRVIVTGELNLTELHTIRPPFALTNSIIQGRLFAPFTVYEGTVDFTGSCFQGEEDETTPVDLHGAIFLGDVTWPQVTFGKTAESVTDLQRVRFRGTADLRGAHFFGLARFQNATFEERAFFQQTKFHQGADFKTSAFYKRAAFLQTIFSGRADFEGASAAAEVDFSGAEFGQTANFRRFSVGGLLSLRDVAFQDKVILDRASVAGLELLDNELGEGVELSLAQLKADSLEIDLGYVDRIDDYGEKLRVLDLVERTARDDGNADVANDASFRRQALENEERAQPWQFLDLVFRQGMAGYFVRPLHPLFSMLALAAVAWLIRLPRRSFGTGRPWNKGNRTLGESLVSVFSALGASVGVIFSLRPRISIGQEDRNDLRAWLIASGRWLEWFGHKILAACLIVAIGNTSPAAKDIISSILKF